MQTGEPTLDSSLMVGDVSGFTDLYHPAVRAFIGSIVGDSTIADELTEGFFLDLAMREDRGRRSRTRREFHDDLKQAARQFLADVRRSHARKRRPAEHDRHSDCRFCGWDGRMQPASPEQNSAFLRGLTQGIVWTALRHVSDSCKQRGRQQHFRLFVGRFLAPTADMPSWRALAEPFAIDETAARNRAETVARQVRLTIRELVAIERGSSESVDEDIRELISLF